MVTIVRANRYYRLHWLPGRRRRLSLRSHCLRPCRAPTWRSSGKRTPGRRDQPVSAPRWNRTWVVEPGILPLAAGSTTFVTAAPPGTYFARVVAVNAAGVGPASNEAAVTLGAGICTIPAVPTGVTALPQVGAATLRWNAPASGAIPTGYTLQVGTLPGLPTLARWCCRRPPWWEGPSPAAPISSAWRRRMPVAHRRCRQTPAS